MFSREVGGDPADFNFDLDGDADDTDVDDDKLLADGLENGCGVSDIDIWQGTDSSLSNACLNQRVQEMTSITQNAQEPDRWKTV